MSKAGLNRWNSARNAFDNEHLKTLNIELANCEWDSKKHVLTYRLDSNSFPDRVFVRSHHTGKVVCFVADKISAERNEWWDGEMYEYITMSNDPKASKIKLVILAY